MTWPLEDENRVYSSKYYKTDSRLAREAGVDLSQHMNQSAVAGYSPRANKFFMLFYNMAEVQGCNKDYLIQKVKLRKTSYNKKGAVVVNNQTHLVEVIKTKNNLIKRADRHVKKYSLSNHHRRSVFAEIEIGCGSIPNIINFFKITLLRRICIIKLFLSFPKHIHLISISPKMERVQSIGQISLAIKKFLTRRSRWTARGYGVCQTQS